jgi:hypothetical protein
MSTPWKRKEIIQVLLEEAVKFVGFERPVTIYAIEKSCAVYVGSTVQPIASRIRAHVSDAKGGSDLPIHKWMRENDYSFSVRHLETVIEEERILSEKRWLKKLGNSLLNVTDGGPGMSGHKFRGTDHARRIGSALRTGATFSCVECGSEFWRKRRDIIKGHNKFCSRDCYHSWQRGKPKMRGKCA